MQIKLGKPVRSGVEVFFRHYVDDKRTYCVMAVGKKDLSQSILAMKNGKPSFFNLVMGIARVHPNDRYSKARGRTEAFKNVVIYQAELVGTQVDKNGTTYHVIVGKDEMVFSRKHGKKFAKLDHLIPSL